MRTLHLFAGAGGDILADLLLGHRPVGAVEVNAYCRRVLDARMRDGSLPWFPLFGAIEEFDGLAWRGVANRISAGFPCQGISAAGKGRGLEDPRSGLWRELARVVGEVAPEFVFLENSPLLVSRGLDRVLADLAEMGFDARWGVMGTDDAGGHCRGKRFWLVAQAAGERRSEVLCREPGLCGQPEPQPESTNDAHPRRRLDRIHALESLVGEPAILGSRDGVAHRVDRLRAVGNGQDPRVAAAAWTVLCDDSRTL